MLIYLILYPSLRNLTTHSAILASKHFKDCISLLFIDYAQELNDKKNEGRHLGILDENSDFDTGFNDLSPHPERNRYDQDGRSRQISPSHDQNGRSRSRERSGWDQFEQSSQEKIHLRAKYQGKGAVLKIFKFNLYFSYFPNLLQITLFYQICVY